MTGPCTRYGLSLLATLMIWTMPASAADDVRCGSKYTVQDGDTLSAIAERAYGLSNKWTLIYYGNQKQFGNEPIVTPGNQITIPCLKAPDPVNVKPASATDDDEPAKIQISRIDADINLLTADDYQPFTDRALPAGGMITDIVRKGFDALSGPKFRISWVNDWSAHLNPLLADKVFDMGFPWLQPNCDQYGDLDQPAQFRCDRFFFSKPVFEILVVFFTLNDTSFEFASDDEVIGKRICRPVGYFTFDLDKDGRNWVKEEKITLVRPQSVDECFRLLQNQEVDAVALNEFTGRSAIKKNKIEDRITVIERPISLEGLHVIVSKTHPRARTFLHYVNSAVQRLRETGDYRKIVDEHLSKFWGSEEAG
ncbi:MAG: hypothetical protein ACR2PM_06995 [Hyphomicrobiales bacterium]